MPATRNYGQHTPNWSSLLNILFQTLDTTRNWRNSRELEWKNATQAIKLQEVLTNAQIGIHCTLDLDQKRWKSNSRSFFILTETFTCNGIQTDITNLITWWWWGAHSCRRLCVSWLICTAIPSITLCAEWIVYIPTSFTGPAAIRRGTLCRKCSISKTPYNRRPN